MKKMQLADVLQLEDYENKRPDYRAHILKIKAERRISVGPYMTFMFETYETMLYQVQEMVRAEKLTSAPAIQHEINVFNKMVPDRHQLCATLFIAIPQKEVLEHFIAQVVDLPEHTFLDVGGKKIFPQFDPGRVAADKISAIRFVTFSVPEKSIQGFRDSACPVKLGFDHPLYTFDHVLNADQKSVLYTDMTRQYDNG